MTRPSIFGFWKRQQPASPIPAASPVPAAPATPEREERRQAPRRNVTPVIVHIRTGQDDEKIEGLVLDVSKGGLCLSVKWPLQVGTAVEIRPANAASAVPWTQVEVRHCESMFSRWKVGFRFAQEPVPQVLALFGG
jgi:hypothetical protein